MTVIASKQQKQVELPAQAPRTRNKTLHDQLCVRAEKWLRNQGCGVVFRDPFKAMTHSGEQPDAIGWRDGLSILIEVKTSRSDFLADARKGFRKSSEQGMGDWRIYMSPPGIITLDDLPFGWALLHVTAKQVKKVHGLPLTGC